MSIRKNLLIWLLTGFVFAGLLTGIATYFKTHEEVGEMLDYELRQIAYSMQYSSSFMPDQLEKIGDANRDDNDFVVQVWNKNGTLLYSSRPSTRLPRASTQGFSTITSAEEDWRAFTLVTDKRVIQTAQTKGDRWEIAAGIAMRMLAPLAVLVPVLVFLGWIAVRKSLAPLARVTAEVERRDASAMAPLDTGPVPEEIRPLLMALNRLLGRLDESIASQRRFVADAAHELRTPLTALSLQAQLVEQAQDAGERNESARSLRLGIARASRLVNQLLTLARQEPDAQRPFARVDLALLVRQVAGELAPLADLKKIDLGVSAEQPEWVNGDEDGLRILVGNLVDNAIRYTPEGGKVDVILARDGNRLVLDVRDNGPGITPGEREKIFERFYRIAGNEVQGSGLGLAIVRQIVERHGAAIEISAGENGTGAVFSIKFPSLSPG
ncbi:MAG TPA: ATP-binding protein [Gallionella sp.]|nr:ATP-binding protein [Gallionella sp.]